MSIVVDDLNCSNERVVENRTKTHAQARSARVSRTISAWMASRASEGVLVAQRAF
jgi:hypothetical protein